MGRAVTILKSFSKDRRKGDAAQFSIFQFFVTHALGGDMVPQQRHGHNNKKWGGRIRTIREKRRILLFYILCLHTRHMRHGTAIAPQKRRDRTDSRRTKRIEMREEQQPL